jgi:hypothetical protein
MPLKLMQGVTIGIDKVSRTPCIATQGGFLADIRNSLNGSTHVETEDIDGINYISEGFLNRYSFEIKPKKKNFWALIGTAVAIAVIAVAGVVGSVFTGGAAGVGAGAAIVALTSTVVTAGVAVTSLTAVGIAVVTASAFVVAATAAVGIA